MNFVRVKSCKTLSQPKVCSPGVGGVEVWEHGGGEVGVLLSSTLFFCGVGYDILWVKLELNSKTSKSVIMSLGFYKIIQ